tara:strand:- start:62 stop:247 length:186 start_codon:yes stop_codon:yes gene_type:complete
MDMNVPDAVTCKEQAYAIGRKHKDKIEELGGFMDEYRVQCMAIDSEGYNVDHSFDISYNVL